MRGTRRREEKRIFCEMEAVVPAASPAGSGQGAAPAHIYAFFVIFLGAKDGLAGGGVASEGVKGMWKSSSQKQ